MKSVQIPLRAIGNSRGIVIPKPVLAQVGLESAVDLTVERGAIVLRKPVASVRSGWAEAAQKVASQGDDALVMGEFGNADDDELSW
ncbi:MAG TPA: AbrB/MazE/SpoVT family DNA-binding domain-containing protein [Variovorax sp.]|nr:AbrB/MazE/SpoVT family DNA-binding domain-containing protein [Variovorax sp.]